MAIQSAGQLVGVSRPPQIGQPRRRMSLAGRSMTYARIYEQQPAVRTVVGFLARNAADIGIHAFSMSEDGQDRTRQRDTPLARVIRRPNLWLTQYDWVFGIVADLCIFDFHLSVKVRTSDGMQLVPVPAELVEPIGKGWMWPEGFRIGGRTGVELEPKDVFYVHGYNPTQRWSGVSPMEALRQTLSADLAAEEYRESFWANGAQIAGVLRRPATAPQWSPQARDRFLEMWRARYSGLGSEMGGTPLLEDGMEYDAGAGATAKDSEYTAARKLTREEVAAVYFTSPTMVGILDNANYSNVKEFHKGLYQDTLGPTFTQLQQAMWLQIVPDLGDADRDYLEFNIMAKLAGTFEEQATIFSTAVGGPWMTRDEARARVNLPQLSDQGTDQLIVPMNVTEGGQASPRDSAPPKTLGPIIGPHGTPGLRTKAKAEPFEVEVDPVAVDEATKVLAATVARQERVVMARYEEQKSTPAALTKAVAEDLFGDMDRWNRELADDLADVARTIALDTAGKVYAAAALDADDATVAPMRKWLNAKAQAQAEAINTATLELVKAALLEDDPEAALIRELVDNAVSRAAALGSGFATNVTGFAAVDTARAVGYGTKEWVVTSAKSRHPELNGERVPIGETFSNGARWPGDYTAGPDEAAGCACALVIVQEDS